MKIFVYLSLLVGLATAVDFNVTLATRMAGYAAAAYCTPSQLLKWNCIHCFGEFNVTKDFEGRKVLP